MSLYHHKSTISSLFFMVFKGKIVNSTPVSQMFHLLPVSLLVVHTDQPHRCNVICKLHSGVLYTHRNAVIDEQ